MVEAMKWRDGVRVVRSESLEAAVRAPGGTGRATAFDFSGSGGRQTWIGIVSLKPGAKTGAHHHGRYEVAVYIARGRTEIRWGEHLEYVAEVGHGDFVYFAPFVPHQETNLGANEPVEFVVVRSDNEKIAVKLDVAEAESPETLF